MTKTEEKRRLRRTMQALEGNLSSRYKEASSRAITDHLLAMPEYQESGTVFCFVGTEREIDTRPILEDALASGKRLCVPLCTGPGIMELRQITELSQLSPGAYGIPEPPAGAPRVDTDAVDFAILPCVTCNHPGQRLGRGGTVLLCREKLIREEIPLEPHDYPVPWVLTERGLYEDGIPARLG